MSIEKAAYIAAFLFLIVQQRFIKSIDIWGQLGVLSQILDQDEKHLMDGLHYAARA